MDEVYLRMGRTESLIMSRATMATHAPQNSTAAILENVLARFARIETRLIEHERRAAAMLPPLRPEPDPPDAATFYTVAQLPQQYLQSQQLYQPPAPPPDALQWQQPQHPEMQDWRWQQHQPHTQSVQTRRPTSWDPPDSRQQSGFMSYHQYPRPYHHWENNQPLTSPPQRTNSCWDPPQLHTTHSAYDHPLAQYPPPLRPLPCYEPDQIITSEIMGLVEEKIEAGEYDQESEKKENYGAEGKLVDEEFCHEIELIPDSHSLSLGHETTPHQTTEKNDSLNGMGSFLDEIGDSKSTQLDDSHKNKATFDVDEFREMEPQYVKLRDDSDLDLNLCVGDVTSIFYHSTSLDADARFIPPRIDLPCLSVLGYTGELFAIAWNFADYIGSPLVILDGNNDGRRSVIRCAFDPGGDRSRQAYVITDSLLCFFVFPP